LDTGNEKIRNGILLEFAKTVELFNLTPIEARVFAFLYVKGTPLTLDDLVEELGKSKTSMSNSIRSLVELNLVKRVWKKGVRKDLFLANTQLYKHFMSLYMKKWIDQVEDRKEALMEINKEIQQLPEKKDQDVIQDKLNSLIAFHIKLDQFFKEASKIKKDGEQG
jgi:HTH-type transcriptional regulator, osmoprotectant uptake regulator